MFLNVTRHMHMYVAETACVPRIRLLLTLDLLRETSIPRHGHAEDQQLHEYSCSRDVEPDVLGKAISAEGIVSNRLQN